MIEIFVVGQLDVVDAAIGQAYRGEGSFVKIVGNVDICISSQHGFVGERGSGCVDSTLFGRGVVGYVIGAVILPILCQWTLVFVGNAYGHVVARDGKLQSLGAGAGKLAVVVQPPEVNDVIGDGGSPRPVYSQAKHQEEEGEGEHCSHFLHAKLFHILSFRCRRHLFLILCHISFNPLYSLFVQFLFQSLQQVPSFIIVQHPHLLDSYLVELH